MKTYTPEQVKALMKDYQQKKLALEAQRLNLEKVILEINQRLGLTLSLDNLEEIEALKEQYAKLLSERCTQLEEQLAKLNET